MRNLLFSTTVTTLHSLEEKAGFHRLHYFTTKTLPLQSQHIKAFIQLHILQKLQHIVFSKHISHKHPIQALRLVT